MVGKVARIHLQPANATGLARAAGGWVIAVAGFILLAAQAVRALEGIDGTLRDALLGGAMAAGATALGAMPLLAVRRIGPAAQGTLLGFGAGVMLAASVFSLLFPAFEAARALGADALVAGRATVAGVALGAALLLALDRSLPHSHAPGTERTVGAVWLFVFAIAAHNIPEGLAIGVAAGTVGSGNAVATGISLQNVPEGLIVAIALASAGYGRVLAFVVAAGSGLVEPVAAIVGSLAVSQSTALLPWGLAGAAGAMMFVVGHEIIPESRRRGHEGLATAGLVAGFIVMMLLDRGLA